MNEHELEALDPELQDLIAAERRRPGMPAEVQERLRERLGAAISGGGGGGTGGSFFERSVPLALAFLLGGLVGAGLHARLARPPIAARPSPPVSIPAPAQPIVVQQPALVSPGLCQPPVPAPVPAKVPARQHVRPAIAPPRPSPPPQPVVEGPSRDAELAAERSLIEIAHTAITRNRAQAAMEAIEQHERQFPNGRLVEEQESLMVQALVLLGRGDEARRRAERFRQRFPRSLLQPVVDEAIKSIQ